MIAQCTVQKALFTLLITAALVIAIPGTALSEQVTRQEAVAVADLWHAMEINDEHSALDPDERAARLAGMKSRRVFYLVSEEALLNSPPKEGKVSGYVVTYEPTGYVVVSGEDRIEPILVFDIDSPFTWKLPQAGFMRHYLKNALLGRWEVLEEKLAKKIKVPVHGNWIAMRARLKNTRRLDNVQHLNNGKDRSIYVKWDTPLWNQGQFYNEMVLAVHGYQWPAIPTGCVATAMAIKMRYHEWPLKGQGDHSYDDDEGDVQHDNHYANFGAQDYWWSAMPMEDLVAHNPDVSNLMYHCGVSVEMNYEANSSGADTADAEGAMEDFFRYWDCEYNTSNHEPDAIQSIRGGLPVQMGGKATSGKGAHGVVACGYRDTASPHFYINCGWSGADNGWYNLGDVSGNHYTITKSLPFCQPTGWIYVSNNGSSTGTGSLRNPILHLLVANTAVPSGGQIWLESGLYDVGVPIKFSKKMKIQNYHGQVVIE